MNQQSFNRLVKWSGLAVIGFVISPIVYMTIKGLVGLAVAMALAGLLHALTPAFAQWLTQLKFGALKGVISRAPVEALTARLNERWNALTEQAGLLKQQAAELQQFKQKTARFIVDYPEEAAAMNEKLVSYEKLFALRTDMFKRARRDTEEFARKVDKAEAVYQMAVADQKLSKSFGKQKDFDAYFKEKVAFEEIDKASAASLASLQMALLDDELDKKVDVPVHAIKYGPSGEVLTGSILEIERVEAK